MCSPVLAKLDHISRRLLLTWVGMVVFVMVMVMMVMVVTVMVVTVMMDNVAMLMGVMVCLNLC